MVALLDESEGNVLSMYRMPKAASSGGVFMKALTIHQPFASLVAIGVKHIATHSFKTNYRGPIAIHAGKAKPPVMSLVGNFQSYLNVIDGGYMARDVTGQPMRPFPLPLGAVVATANLVDCVPIVDRWSEEDDGGRCLMIGDDGRLVDILRLGDVSDQLPYGDFAPGMWGWLLEDVTAIDPVSAKGRQGLWNWETV